MVFYWLKKIERRNNEKILKNIEDVIGNRINKKNKVNSISFNKIRISYKNVYSLIDY